MTLYTRSLLALATAPLARFVQWLSRPVEELLDPFGDDQLDQRSYGEDPK